MLRILEIIDCGLMIMPDLIYLDDLKELSLTSNHNLLLNVHYLPVKLVNLYFENNCECYCIDLSVFTNLQMISLKCTSFDYAKIRLPVRLRYLNLSCCSLMDKIDL